MDKFKENGIIKSKLCVKKGNCMKKNDKMVVESFSMVLQFGLNMIIPIAMCMALGIWIGDKYDMDWITIPFFFIGALAGYTSIFKMVRKFLKNPDRRTKKEHDVKKN